MQTPVMSATPTWIGPYDKRELKLDVQEMLVGKGGFSKHNSLTKDPVNIGQPLPPWDPRCLKIDLHDNLVKIKPFTKRIETTEAPEWIGKPSQNKSDEHVTTVDLEDMFLKKKQFTHDNQLGEKPESWVGQPQQRGEDVVNIDLYDVFIKEKRFTHTPEVAENPVWINGPDTSDARRSVKINVDTFLTGDNGKFTRTAGLSSEPVWIAKPVPIELPPPSPPSPRIPWTKHPGLAAAPRWGPGAR